MNDISIDLETLSTRQDAAILSIGAVEFDRETGVTGARFYAEIDINDAIRHGHVSGDTLAWWIGQGDSARGLFDNQNDKVSLAMALSLLSSFVGDAHVWGNGATFDISILENAHLKVFDGYGKAPWDFWKIRDMRTIVDVAGALGFEKAAVEFVGIPHHALDDAVHQAKVISKCWQLTTCREPVADLTAQTA